MRRTMPIALLALALSGAAAQEEEPEIRRAVPVLPDASGGGQPGWMRHVPPESGGQAPQPTPAPGSAQAEPWRPRPTTEVPSAPAAEEGTIRLSPREGVRDEAAESLAAANTIYAKKMFDLAASEYEKFLVAYPKAAGRDMALFRLGECHRIEGDRDAAIGAYTRLTGEFRKGAFFGAASYRLGEVRFADGRHDHALKHFDAAARESTEDQVRLAALYQKARCLDRLGKHAESVEILREVTARRDANPYREHALLALADALGKAGKKDEAIGAFTEIVRGNNPDAMRAEAAVKAGALAAEAGDPARASAFFLEALALEGAGPWRGVAVLGSMRLHAATGKDAPVAEITEEDLDLLDGEALAEALSLAADANRRLGRPERALAFHERLSREFPESPFHAKARFQKILALHETGAPGVRAGIEAFLRGSPPPGDRDRANLLLAEILFNEEQYDAASARYLDVRDSSLPDDLKLQAAYKAAWSLAKAGKHRESADAFTRFLESHPDAPQAPGALIQRGIARQQLGDFAGALEDFTGVIDKWPDAREREFVLQQKALVLGQLEDHEGMRRTFERLLEEYPESAGRAQAEFWIGWVLYESKNYAEAVPRLDRARKLDPANYGERAGMRLLLCHYYAEDRKALAAEAAPLDPSQIPREVLRWLGLRSATDGDFESAARYLGHLVESGAPDPDALLVLADSRNAMGLHAEAAAAAQACLGAVREPPARARALLSLAAAQKGLGEYDRAAQSVADALMLQPEGRINADARMAAAEIDAARGDFDAAARAFMSVALLYDDPAITPRALARAADCYRRDNNTPEAERALDELRVRFPNFQASATIP
jgi:tetratricopeptide (TPR) repeat protein